MSDQQNRDGGDPSMEEILASIRKIISEEGEDRPRDKLAPRTDDSDVSPDKSPEAEEAAVQGLETPAGSGDTPEEAAGGEDDVLDLTDEVAEADEHPDTPSESETLAWEREPGERTGEMEAGDREDEPEPAGAPTGYGAQAGDEEAVAAGTAAVEPPEEEESSLMTADTGGTNAKTRDSVMSEETSATATSALTELARAANARDFGDDQPKSAADRILEQLVREALRPQLKAWLDENLPGLVERVVREEIRRMTQRAELSADSEREG